MTGMGLGGLLRPMSGLTPPATQPPAMHPAAAAAVTQVKMPAEMPVPAPGPDGSATAACGAYSAMTARSRGASGGTKTKPQPSVSPFLLIPTTPPEPVPERAEHAAINDGVAEESCCNYR